MRRIAMAIIAVLALGLAAHGADLDIYQGVVLTANPDKPDEVTSYMWIVDSPDRKWIPVSTEQNGRVAKFLTGSLEVPGLYRVLCITFPTGEQMLGNFEIKGDVKPDPEPDPEPEPGPDPEPEPEPEPNPTGEWQVAFFYETNDADDMSLEQRAMVMGQAFRDQLKKDGHYFFGAFDIDSRVLRRVVCTSNGCVLVEVPETDMKAWWDSVEGSPMPAVAIAPKAGGSVAVFPMPSDGQALYRLLEEQE